MVRLDFHHDFTSPFCRVGLAAAQEAARRRDVVLEPVPFELFPAPAPLPAGDALADEVARAQTLAAQQGVDLVLPRLVGRTRKAHEAVVHARAEGLALELLAALYDAVWRDGADVSRLDTVVDVATRAGVEPAGLHVALGLDTHEPEVLRAQRAAEAAGIDAVPAFGIGGALLTGAVPAADLLRWLDSRR